MAGKGAALAMILSARDEGVSGVLSGVEKSVGGFGETLKGAFASLGALGIVEGITSGITSIVGGAIEAADATGRLQAQLGLTADQAAELGQAATNAFRNGFGESAAEVNAAMATVRQNLGDIGAEAAQSATEAALTLKDLFGAAETESTRTVSVMMKNFDGLSQTQAFDLITAGFQQGGDYSGELLDTLREYSPQFAKMGMSAEQMMGVLISGAQAGAFNLDKVGDAVKEFAIRSIDGSKATKEGFAAIGLDADQMAAKIAQGGKSSEQAFQATIAGLAAMEDPVKRNAAGVALFGTQWEDVGPKVVEAMAAGMNGVQGFEGATSRAATASAGIGVQFETLKRQAMGLLIDGITPLMPGFMALATGAIGSLQSMLGPIREIGTALASIFGGSMTGMMDGMAVLMKFFPPETVKTITNLVLGLGETFRAVMGGDIAGAIQGALGVLEDFGSFIASAVEGWASAFAAWVDGADSGMTDGLADLLIGLQTWIQTAGFAIIERLAIWAGAFVDWVGPKIPPLLAELGSLLAQLLGWVLSTGLPNLISKLAEWGAAFVAWVLPRIPPLLAALGGLLVALGGWLLGTALPAIVNQLLQWGDAFTAWVMPMIPLLLAQLVLLQLQLLAWIGQQVVGIGTALLAWAKAFVDWVATAVAEIPGKLGEILSAITGWIGGAVGTVRDGARGIGQAIIDGISGGISAGIGAIRNMAASAANSALEAAKSALGIESPSTVFRDQVGQMIPAGVIEGIDRMAAPMNAAISGMVQPPSLRATAAQQSYGGGFGGQPMVFTLTVNGSVLTDRDLQEVIGQAFDDSLRYGGRLGRYG